MIRVVLDTSVLVKSIFKPLRSLSAEAYSRELDTHEKCKALMKLIEEQDVEVHVPKVCVGGDRRRSQATCQQDSGRKSIKWNHEIV